MSGPADTSGRKFLLTEGGPTYRIEQSIGLIRKNSPLVVRRALFAILVTWVPLLILSTISGYAVGDRIPVPFLRDFAVHARFLIAVPLLLVAENFMGPRLAHAAEHFVTSGLVIEKDFQRFDAAIEAGLRWRDSTLAELILLAVAYFFTWTAQRTMAIHVSTWHALRTDSHISLTWAGWWFVLICVPLLQFLTLRWIYRQFLWAQFLWRMSRLNLQLIPTHPDEAGGIAFIGEVQRFFGVILFAYSATIAGVLANEILYDKTPLQHFVPLIAVYVILAISVVLAPLLSFTKVLMKTKLSGLYSYGTLATEYTLSFHKKWILSQPPREDVLLGTGDIQSLADLGNSFSFIGKMNGLPMGPRTPIHLALACLVPMAPLLLTVMPLKDILKLLFKMVL
jgi:hypothetical protein